jgi:hypothetical protein
MVFSKVGPNQSIEWGQIKVSKSPPLALRIIRIFKAIRPASYAVRMSGNIFLAYKTCGAIWCVCSIPNRHGSHIYAPLLC